MALLPSAIPVSLAITSARFPAKYAEHHASRERGLPPRDVCRRHFRRQARFSRPFHLSRLHAARPSRVYRGGARRFGATKRRARRLAAAILACIDAGARVLNLSLALMQSSTEAKVMLSQALDHAARRGVVIVAAAGNQGTISSTVITAHSWVIPVAACGSSGKPLNETNLGHSIGRRGLRAPGEEITSLGSDGEPITLGGTSTAAPFVTGAIALVWSQFPSASAAQICSTFVHSYARARHSVVPPLLNAWAAYQTLLTTHSMR